MAAYRLNEFMSDVSDVISFDALKALRNAGHPNVDGDDYVKSGPQYIRFFLKRATENAQFLINAGLPESAFMDDIWEFLCLNIEKYQDAPELSNRQNILACVNLIKVSAKLDE